MTTRTETLRLLASRGTLISALLSIILWHLLWGWETAAVVVLLLYAHEVGHVVAARWRGVPVRQPPVFLPGFGAWVAFGEKEGHTPWDSAIASLGGPVLGLLAAFGANRLGAALDLPAVASAGYFALVVNLLNLAPVSFLDGGQVAVQAGWLGIALAGLASVALLKGFLAPAAFPTAVALILGSLLWSGFSRPARRDPWWVPLGILGLYGLTVALGVLLWRAGLRVPGPVWQAPAFPAVSRGLLWLSGYYLLALFAVPYLVRPQIPFRLRYPLLALLIWPRVLFTTPLTGLFYLLMAAESLGLSGLARLDRLVVGQRERDPRMAGVCGVEGYHYLVKTDREPEAQAWLRGLASALDAGEGLALQYLMAHLVGIEQPQAALALFEERYQGRVGPHSLPVLCNNIAWSYHITGRSVRGLPYARQAVVREPANPSFLDTLGQILVEVGDGAEAEPILRRALGLKQQLCSQVALSRALAAQGRFAEALHMGRQALHQHAGPWPARDLPPRERVIAWLAEWEEQVTGSIPVASGID